jgi:hypothetical protein
MDNCFHKISEKKPGVVPCKDSGQRTRVVEENISGFFTLRRTSKSEAIEMKVSQVDINVMNRWKAVEKAKGLQP